MTSDSDRLDRLEREIAILRAEFARLREHLGAPSAPRAQYKAPPPPPRPAGAESAPPPRPAAPASTPPKPRASFEVLIGRYFVMAFAAVLVLAAVGSLLSWAIRSGLLGPTGRVVLGYAAAAGLAFAGLRLRLRGTREFGNALMAMALGVVHLVCWSAGPLLHVLPSSVALGIGFVASVVLAEFALRHDEEMLCAIGFGGAAIAPFVAGDRNGNRIAFAIYAVIVVALAAAALGNRKWKVARGVTMWSVIILAVFSGAGSPELSPPAWISARLWVATPVVMLLALIPLAHAEHRRTMIRASAGALILGALLRADQWNADLPSLLITALGSVIVIVALDAFRPGDLEREASATPVSDLRLLDRETLLDAFLIPVVLFLSTVAAVPDLTSFQSAAVALFFAGLAAFVMHRARGEVSANKHAATASLIALWIIPAAFPYNHLARAAGCAAMGLVLMAAGRRTNRLPFVVGAIGSFAVATILALDGLDARATFQYVPFVTIDSLAALLAVAGWVIGFRLISRTDFIPELDSRLRSRLREALMIGATVSAFFWGLFELKGAWSPTAATALVIVYYAATGSAAIHFGRLRDIRYLRIIGLVFALFAALKALGEAFGLPNAAVRIAVFALVGLFLIGIGYWYRRGGGEDGSPVAEPA